jgi:hypothetical protein
MCAQCRMPFPYAFAGLRACAEDSAVCGCQRKAEPGHAQGQAGCQRVLCRQGASSEAGTAARSGAMHATACWLEAMCGLLEPHCLHTVAACSLLTHWACLGSLLQGRANQILKPMVHITVKVKESEA